MELWQTAVQELDRLQQLYQRSVSEGQVQGAQRQQLKVRSAAVRLLACTTCCTLWRWYGPAATRPARTTAAV